MMMLLVMTTKIQIQVLWSFINNLAHQQRIFTAVRPARVTAMTGLFLYWTKLQRPTPEDIARRRKVKTNPPPTTKWRCHGSTSSSPKSITPQQQVKEFGEPLTTSNGYLFCRACREQISTKLSVIKNHLRSTKHSEGKERLKGRKPKK